MKIIEVNLLTARDGRGQILLDAASVRCASYLLNGERVLLVDTRGVACEANVYQRNDGLWYAVLPKRGDTVPADDVFPEDISIEPWSHGGWKLTLSVQETENLKTHQSLILRHPDSLEKLQDAVNLAMVKAP